MNWIDKKGRNFDFEEKGSAATENSLFPTFPGSEAFSLYLKKFPDRD